MRRSPAVVDRKAIAEHAWADETDPLGLERDRRPDEPAPREAARRRHPHRDRPRRGLPAGGGVTARPPGQLVRRQSIRVALAATASSRSSTSSIAAGVIAITTREPHRQIDAAAGRHAAAALAERARSPDRRRRGRPTAGAGRPADRPVRRAAARLDGRCRTATVRSERETADPARPSLRRVTRRRRRRSPARTSGSPARTAGGDHVVVGQTMEPVDDAQRDDRHRRAR